MSETVKVGTLHGLGVGPGDPELLTLKALRRLKASRVIAYPAPEGGASFARSIVAQFLDGQEEIEIAVPMRIDRFPAGEVYDAAAERIAKRLDRGDDVAVLCEGDPFFYGSFVYLFERLSPRYRTEIVPGVSSVMAAAAAARRPLAARNDILTVIPGPLDDTALEERICASQAFAIMKLGRHFARVSALMARLGLVERCAYCERIGLRNQKTMPLGEAIGAAAPYFSMIVGYRGTEPGILASEIARTAPTSDLGVHRVPGDAA